MKKTLITLAALVCVAVPAGAMTYIETLAFASGGPVLASTGLDTIIEAAVRQASFIGVATGANPTLTVSGLMGLRAVSFSISTGMQFPSFDLASGTLSVSLFEQTLNHWLGGSTSFVGAPFNAAGTPLGRVLEPTFSLSNFAGAGSVQMYAFGSATAGIAPVPEPATYASFFLGLLAIAWLSMRQPKSSKADLIAIRRA